MGLSGSSLKRALFLAGVAATALTGVLSSVSSGLTREHRVRSATSVARQVAMQAESLYSEAREQGEKDPLGWVVFQLSRGEDPRVVRVSRIARMDRAPASQEDRETQAFNEDEGLLDFSRRFVFDAATGVRILVSAPYIGYLGARSKALGDLLLFGSWLMLFGLAFGFFRALDEKVLLSPSGASVGGDESLDEGEAAFPRLDLGAVSRPAPAPAQVFRSGPDRELLSESLREAARSIKGLFEGTVKFARSLAEVNSHVASLRKSIHRTLSEAHRDEGALGEWIEAVRDAEVEGLNGVASMARIREHFLARGFAVDSVEMKALAQMNSHYERIARLAHEGRGLSEKLRERIASIELALEPLSADADLAAQACERAFAASGEIDLATIAVQRRIVDHSRLLRPDAGDASA